MTTYFNGRKKKAHSDTFLLNFNFNQKKKERNAVTYCGNQFSHGRKTVPQANKNKFNKYNSLFVHTNFFLIFYFYVYIHFDKVRLYEMKVRVEFDVVVVGFFLGKMGERWSEICHDIVIN